MHEYSCLMNKFLIHILLFQFEMIEINGGDDIARLKKTKT